MSTKNVPVFNKYLGNGVATQFSIGFPYLERDYVKVYLLRKDGAQELLDSSRYKYVNDKVIEFPVLPSDAVLAEGDVLTIQRETTLGSNYEFDNQRRLFPEQVMDADDLSFQQIQELARDISRAVKTSPTDTITGDELLAEFNQRVVESKEAAIASEQSAAESASSANAAAQSAQQAANTASGFDTHYAEKVQEFDTNAQQKLDAYNQNDTTKTAAFNSNATAKTSAFDTNAQQKLDSFNTNAAEKQAAVDASAEAAKKSETNAANSAEEAAQYAIKASFGNIGDIKYTTRIDAPNGGAWCDGAEYTQAAFPDLYQMLVDGKISSTDYSTFNNSVSTNGSCGLFALDSSAQKFKVPLLTNIYIKAGQAPSMFGAESLPNIKGSANSAGAMGWVYNASWSGAFKNGGTTRGNGPNAGGASAKDLSFDASLYDARYQDGAKVNPDHVVYRAYVVLYASAAEASEAQAAEFMTALGGKVNTDLSNVSANIDYVVESYFSGTEDLWYSYEKWKSGKLIQRGKTLYANIQGGTTSYIQYHNIDFPKPFKNLNYIVKVSCVKSSNNGLVLGCGADTLTTTGMHVGAGTYNNNIVLAQMTWEVIGEGAE